MNTKTIISVKKTGIILGLLVCLCGVSYAQQSTSTAANAGREFYITYLNNGNITPILQLKVVVEKACTITARYNNSGTYWHGWNNTPVQPGIYTDIVTNADVIESNPAFLGTTSSKTITITSSEDVCVYAVNYMSSTSDGTCILPVTAWGTKYRIASGNVASGDYAEFAVVAQENNTTVNTLYGQTIPLNKNQVLHYRGSTAGEDLTGKEITANKPIGFYSGATLAYGTGAGCPTDISTGDHTYEQLWSIDKWGREFYIFPIATPASLASGSGRLVVVADQPSTTVTLTGGVIGGNLPITLATAGSKQYVCDAITGMTKIVSNKPIMVFMVLADASIINIPAVNQRISHAFVSPFILQGSSKVNSHGIDLLIPYNYWNQTVIKENGVVVNNNTYTVNLNPTFPEWCHVRKNLPNTDVKIDIACPGGFLAFMSGSGNGESYGFSAGSGSYNLQNFFTIKEQATSLYTYYKNTNATTHTFDDSDTLFVKRTIETPFNTPVTWKINGVFSTPMVVDNTSPQNDVKFAASVLHAGENDITMVVRYTGASADSTYTGKVWKHEDVILCAGESVTFVASTLNVGNNATYDWTVNGVSQNVTIDTFTYIPADGDRVRCNLSANDACFTPVTTLSHNLKVNVYPPLTAGTIGAPQSICVTEKAAEIKELTPAAGGSNSITYQWQVSNDSSSWSDILGETTNNYTPPALSAGTYYYRRAATDVQCGTVYTAGVKITVYAEPILTTEITGLKTVCVDSTITLANTTLNGVWSATNSNVSIANPAVMPVSITGVSSGNTFITYTLKNGVCEVKKTFLLKVLPQTNPNVNIGFEK